MKNILIALVAYLGRIGRESVQSWNRFWFTPTDPITLATIRICTGIILLYIQLTCYPILMDLIGPNAWVDQQAIQERKAFPEKLERELIDTSLPDDVKEFSRKSATWHSFSIWFWVTEPTAIWLVQGFFLVCMLCMTLGLFTRVATLLTWIAHLSFVHRGYIVWFGIDSMLSFILLYLTLAPSGLTFSLDNVWRRYRRLRGLEPAAAVNADPQSHARSWMANVSIRLLQIHMCIVYFCAGVSKLQGPAWWSGYASWITMNTPEFALFDMNWLAFTPDWVWQWFCLFGSYFTLAFEIAFPFIIWPRWLRPISLFLAVLLHAGIGLFMGLISFGNVMLTGCMSFVRPESMRWFLHQLLGSSKRLTYYLNPKNAAQREMARWLRTMDAWNQIDIVETNTDATHQRLAGQLLLPSGTTRTGLGIFWALLPRLRTLWLLGPVFFFACRRYGRSA